MNFIEGFFILLGIIFYTIVVVSIAFYNRKCGTLYVGKDIQGKLETEGQISFSFNPDKLEGKKYVVFEVTNIPVKLT